MNLRNAVSRMRAHRDGILRVYYDLPGDVATTRLLDVLDKLDDAVDTLEIEARAEAREDEEAEVVIG